MIKKLFVSALALLAALSGASAQDNFRCYVLTPVGIEDVTVGKNVKDLPASHPDVYASLDQIADGCIVIGKTISMSKEIPFFTSSLLCTNNYYVKKEGRVIDEHRETFAVWTIDWKAAGRSDATLEQVFVGLEPPSIEFFSRRPLSLVLEDGKIAAIYVYSPRFKTAEHGLCATSSMWDLYKAGGELVLSRSGETVIEADGVRFHGINFMLDENGNAFSVESMDQEDRDDWFGQFGDKDEIRFPLDDPRLVGDSNPDEEPALQLSFMSMHACYIVVDKQYRPKGYESAMKAKPAKPMTAKAPGEPNGYVLSGSSFGMPAGGQNGASGTNGASSQNKWVADYRVWPELSPGQDISTPLSLPGPQTYLISKDAAGPVKMGTHREKADKLLKELFPLIIDDVNDMGEEYMLRCCTGEDYTTEALTFYCGEPGPKEDLIQHYYVSDGRARTSKGLSVQSTYQELIKAGGKWLPDEGCVALDGLYFFFSVVGTPDPGSTPTLIGNVKYLMA